LAADIAIGFGDLSGFGHATGFGPSSPAKRCLSRLAYYKELQVNLSGVTTAGFGLHLLYRPQGYLVRLCRNNKFLDLLITCY